MDLPQNMDSKFRYILVAAKRARQLQAGAKALVQTQSKKLTRVAQQEVGAGLVPIEVSAQAAENDEKVTKAKASK